MSEHPAHRAEDRLRDGLAKGVNAPETSSGSTGFRSQNRFTDPATRKKTGAWWTRQLRGPYCPVVSREMLRSDDRR